tara:strand:- start:160 stop:1161 length:1002 start_codon:yes stop_codon:yes gene_type:complete
MATDFKYASQSDLKNYFNRFGDYDQKVQIFPTLTSGNLHLFRDSGYVDTLFLNGEELAAAQSSSGAVDTNGEWFYNSSTNQVEYYNSSYSSTTINEQVFEAGIDFSTFIDQQLVNASFELNNIIDKRYPTPIPKHPMYDANSTAESAVPEYDPIIVRATCYIAASNLIRSKEGVSEEADMYYDKVTNIDGTGIADRLNKGDYKLAYEVDSGDSKGNIRAGSGNGGSMDIVETGGAYVGEPYENLLITCTTGGAYGVAIVKVAHFGNDKIQGSEKTNIKITGGLQSIYSGWYCRFQGATMNSGDTWEIGLYSETRKITNAESGGIQLTRRGYGI